MKTSLRALALAAALGAPALAAPPPALTEEKLGEAILNYIRAGCFLDRAKEVKGDEGRLLLDAAVAAYDTALGIVKDQKEDQAASLWNDASQHMDTAQRLLKEPEFAPGAPVSSSAIVCAQTPTAPPS